MGGQLDGSTVESEMETAANVTSEQDIAVLRGVLKEIIEGPAFRGSHRSGQFLEFVVEAWIAGNFDQLKERLIGVQLFKRKPAYDTGEDAIVRVTASDVRKRLLQHYGWFGNDCEFRIDLPSGSYVPRIHRRSQAKPVAAHSLEPVILVPETFTGGSEPSEILTHPIDAQSVAVAPSILSGVLLSRKAWPLWLKAGSLVLAATLGWWIHSLSHSPSSVLPWSTLFNSSVVTHLVTSDPNIDAFQGVTHS